MSGATLRVLAASCAAAALVGPPAAQGQTAASGTGLKGVLEPINYPEDLKLTDVFFVTPEIGYVAGAAGTILKTTDSGASWTPLLGGDPLSEERAITQLVFVTPTAGWATQISGSTNLLRTTDGENWELIGTIPEHYDDLAFSSETEGVYLHDKKIFRTQDGGRTWSEVYHCATRAQIGGLTRQLECSLWKGKVRFATPTVAYALGDAVDADAAVVLKSTDAGASWDVVAVIENQYATEGGLFFTDENTGYVAMKDATASFRTVDGGVTWTGMPATSIHRHILFADPEVGWAMRYNNLAFTTDGGRRWSSRTLQLPAFPNAFSLPRRDIAYLVGDHGMIYRYRVVPAAEPVPAGAVAAPAMPALATEVLEQIDELDAGLESFAAAVEEAAASGSDAAASADGSTASATESAGTGEFWAGGPELEAQFSELQATVDEIAVGVPEVGRKHRNLNLLTVGLQLLSDLSGQGSGLKNAFASLRQAGDLESTSAALGAMAAELEAMRASVAAFDSDEQ
jgi:photosystem II stability/assembly factor-like uncharacterized protein